MSEFRPNPAKTIGLVGGVASGKSTVARMMADEGLVHLDADAEGRRVVEDPAVLALIRAEFGADVIQDGALDRQALADVVFGDRAKLRALEAITHPAIRAALERGIEQAHARGQSVVLDVPLLLEGGLVDRCDEVVFVEADDRARAERARARGWSDGELARREANQSSLSCKSERATYRVDTSGSLTNTRGQVQAMLAHIALSPGAS